MISNQPFRVLRGGGIAVTLGFFLFRQKKTFFSLFFYYDTKNKIESFYQAWNNVFEIHPIVFSCPGQLNR